MWIGAWWMGAVITGSALICIAPFMTLFPSIIPPPGGIHTDGEVLRKKLEEEKKPASMKEWWQELLGVARRLGTNKIYILNLIASTFILLAIIGFVTFLPKYIEYVFRKRASTSGLVGPLANTGASIIGILISGFVIGKWRPRARK